MGNIGLFGAALLLLASTAASAQDAGVTYGADPSRVVAGKPRSAKPLPRDKYDEAAGKLFSAGDTDRDGIITLDELNAVIAGARDRAIRERFAAIDTNRDQSLSLAEFATWQHSMGSAVLADGLESSGGTLIAEEVRIGFGRGDEDQLIARIIAPLTATALVEANENYDAGASLAEFVAWEGKYFAKVDSNGDGFVTFDELALSEEGR